MTPEETQKVASNINSVDSDAQFRIQSAVQEIQAILVKYQLTMVPNIQISDSKPNPVSDIYVPSQSSKSII